MQNDTVFFKGLCTQERITEQCKAIDTENCLCKAYFVSICVRERLVHVVLLFEAIVCDVFIAMEGFSLTTEIALLYVMTCESFVRLEVATDKHIDTHTSLRSLICISMPAYAQTYSMNMRRHTHTHKLNSISAD